MRNSAVALCFVSLALGSPSWSGELGNVFGTEEIQAASRLASAAALGALELCISALKQRELGVEGGTDLLKAADTLFSASGQMRKLLDSDFPDFDFTVEELDRIQTHLGATGLRYEDIFNAKRFSEFFAAFLLLGDRLAAAMKQASTLGPDQSALATFSELLADYIIIGELVSELSRSRNLR